MNPWTDLTSAALLGAGRGLATIQLPGRLNELLAGSDAEDRLLRAAGVLATAQAAATTAIRSAETAPSPAPLETATPVTEPELTALLARVLEEARAPLLVEACRLLAGAARCLPPRLLPRALELGRKSSALRAPLRRALGQRGAWLAGQNPDWNYAVLAGVEPAEQRLWDEGDIDQRAAFLRRLRADDPAEARRLLETAFPSEPARHRALLLPCLGERLGPDDEPFLAATLASDRSKEVRLAAAALLARLPASAFARRMVARLEPCVRGEKKLLRTVTVIEPPETFAPEWKADALEEQPPASVKLGARAWWLAQIIGYAPLGWWEEKLQSTPAGVLALAAKSEWKAALLAGFRAAIGYQPDHAAWTLAVLERGGFPPQKAVELALMLEPAAADAALQCLLAATDDATLAARIIEAADFGWGLALWRVAQQRLPRWLAQQDWRFRSALALLACRIPPAVLSEEMTWPEPSLFADAIADFSHVLEQRRMLYRCLRPSLD
ncbi:MAG: DUF5691 domain-containing protein [Candidatus Contendobacter sp.]|nr:DUF5691 domain-containing protein [Candidatus Contendobacter sp.]